MGIIYYCFTAFLVATSPTTLVMYSLKLLVFNFLKIDFLTFSRGHHHENQSVLGVGVQKVDVEIALNRTSIKKI